MSGGPAGTSGGVLHLYLRGVLAAFVMVAGLDTINIVTLLHDFPHMSLAEPIILEGSSGLCFLLFSWIPFLAIRAVPPEFRPRWRVLPFHAAAAVVFSMLHVAGFVVLRKAAYAAFGADYDFGAPVPAFLYELRKDMFGYLLIATAFWVTAKLWRPDAAAPAPAQREDRLFDIRDGARLVRVRLAEVLAVSSAGNYVEFVLEDGRRPLMRRPLSALEAELTPSGFVRTHRSWLVNAARVTGLEPEGSGDYRVALGVLSVPLSRRFPEALARLRGG